MSPLSGIIALLTRAAVIFVLLFEKSVGFSVSHGNQVLHLHDEHRHLIAAAQDMSHRNNLGGRVLAAVLHHVWFLIWIIGVISQFLEQGRMPVMRVLYFVFDTGTTIDNEVLVLLILSTYLHVGRAQCLHVIGTASGTVLHLGDEVVGEVARWEVITYVLYKSVCYILHFF